MIQTAHEDEKPAANEDEKPAAMEDEKPEAKEDENPAQLIIINPFVVSYETCAEDTFIRKINFDIEGLKYQIDR